MSAENFIDTNLFIYQLEALDGAKGLNGGSHHSRRHRDEQRLYQLPGGAELPEHRDPKGGDSTQYGRDEALPGHRPGTIVRLPASLSLYRRALDIQARYRYGFYDSLIVAAALDAGCTRLYSEDLQDGQKIEALTIENPLLEL